MEPKLRIPLLTAMATISFGSILFGLAIGVVMAIGHASLSSKNARCQSLSCECSDCNGASCNCCSPKIRPKTKYEATISGNDLPEVNEQARDEVKSAIFGTRLVYKPTCTTCQTTTVTRPAPASPAVTPPQVSAQTPTRLVPGDKPSQEPQRFQISLYLLPGDPQSEQLKQWFSDNATLVEWRSQCTYQEFTPDSPLYKTLRRQDGRSLREVVPPGEFPAVIFAKPDGGHIHAAGKKFIPASAEELVNDVRKANELAKQVPASSGLLRTAGYSWDSQIAPQLRLASADCPDNKCPPDSSAGWVPGEKIRDVFGGQMEKTSWAKDAMWGWLDIIVAGFIALLAIGIFGFLGFIALVAIFYYIRKHGN